MDKPATARHSACRRLQGVLPTALWLCFHLTSPAHAQEMLGDPEFTTSISEGLFPDSGAWKEAGLGEAGAVCSTTAALAGNGLRAYTGTPALHWKTEPYQRFPAVPGTIYRGTAWIRSPQGQPWVAGSKAVIQIWFERGAVTDTWQSPGVTTTNTAWAQYTVETPPAPADTQFVRFVCYLEKPASVPGISVAHFDDCSLAPVTGTPAVHGQWSVIYPLPGVPVHLHLLPTGKVMFWDRHGHSLFPDWHGDPWLLDPATMLSTGLARVNYDLFCAGHIQLPDGRLFVAGGHIDLPSPRNSGVGENKASVYDPYSDTWTRLPNMNAGRWYPTATLLPNGDVLTLAGTTEPETVNLMPQVWQAKTNTWRSLTTALQQGFPEWADFYPWLYVSPNGKIFNAGPQRQARYLDTAGTGSWTDVAASSMPYRDSGSSVMYDEGKVAIIGGNDRDLSINLLHEPSASVEVIDLSSANPQWRQTTPMVGKRRQHTATLLPDGTVLVTGGSSAPGFDEPAGAANFAEVWNPVTETWTALATGARYRGYHSAALLLPDGRVMVTGGGHPAWLSDTANPDQLNAEIFSPPYLFQGPRPVISSAPLWVPYGGSFTINTPDAASIARVNWIRLGSVTHSWNHSQRINRLTFTKTAAALTVTTPGGPHLCPPGHYLLFILNSSGVPSLARIIQITQENPAALSISKVPNQPKVMLTWPSVAAPWSLERTPTPMLENSWLPVTPAPALTGTQFQFFDNIATKAFYRLRQTQP